MYRIGAFSQLSKVTVKTLRYYDEMGLLKPTLVDDTTGYRLYATSQLIPLQRIVSLRQAGLSVEEVSAVLSGKDVQTILLARRTALRWEVSEVEGRLSRLESILKQEDFLMNYQTVMKEVPSYTVFYKEGVVPTYAEISDFVVKAGQECAAANPNLKCVEPDYCFVSYVDKEYKEHDVGLCYAQAVVSAGKETDTIKFKTLPATTVASIYHRGSFERIGEAYAFIMKWLEENGYQVVDSPRERYIDGCWNKERVEDWLTELQVPVKKK